MRDGVTLAGFPFVLALTACGGGALVVALAIGGCSNRGDARSPCSDLFTRFREAVGADADSRKSWFLARCEAADPRVAGCLQEAIGDHPPQMQATAIAWNLPACVQRYRTSRAHAEGVADRVAEAVRAGRIKPGVARLPAELETASLEGTVWIGTRASGQTWIMFPTWRSRGTNVAGYLWSSGPIAPSEISADNQLTIADFCVAEPCSPNPEPEPFTVEERLSDRWMFIRWAWD